MSGLRQPRKIGASFEIIVFCDGKRVQALATQLALGPTRPRPDRPVPVSLVITELDVGGAERALVALATRLDRRRWEPEVVALGPEGPLAEPLRAAGVPTRFLDLKPRQPARAIVRLAAALEVQRPELVQSFLFHANIATRLAGRLAGVPWVLSGIRVAERRKGWHLRLDRWTSRLACGSVCVSRGVERFSRDVAGLPADRLTVIPNGVDPELFDWAAPFPRSAIGVPDASHLALFVGRLDAQKGIPDLLDAAHRVIEQRRDWHLAMVGQGPDRGALVRKADRSAFLLGHVHWLGQRTDVPALLKTADVLVLPSRWEGMPNVVLEAMAARRPVVATAVEGTEELVEPGHTGWLVPPGDSRALANALLEAASDSVRLTQYGEAARLRVKDEFTLERMVAAYDRLWSRVLGFAETGGP